jgi:hypothetical protein
MESQSGPGSALVETQGIREGLPNLIKALNVRTLLDAPCGDFNWMKSVVKSVESELDAYVGVDIWKAVVEQNQNLYGGTKNIQFLVSDIVNSSVPKADLIVCRDCLVHLSFQDGLRAIANFKSSGSRFLAATSYWDITENVDCTTGSWRKVNLEFPPYSLGSPIASIVERGPRCVYGADDYGKLLRVWPLQG